MLWKKHGFIFPILIPALLACAKYYVVGETESLMNEPFDADFSKVMDVTINEAFEDYEERLKNLDIHKSSGYSKNNKHSRGMAAINWIFNSAIKDLEKSFLLNEKDLMVTWDKIHTKIVLHQETKELHTMSSHGTLREGNIEVDGPLIPPGGCDVANALNVNKERYFVHRNRNPCGSTTDADVVKYCNSSRKFDLFRTHSGECNNPDNLRWGSVYSRLARLLPSDHGKINRPTYDNVLKDPSNAVGKSSSPNTKLPNARLASFSLHPDENAPNKDVTLILMQFGQFIDHDISLSPEHENFDCCNNPPPASKKHDPECMEIHIPKNDPFYKEDNEQCMEMTRSEPHCIKPGVPREQFNIITSFLDSSNVYGSDEYRGKEDTKLRSYDRGKLREAPEGRSLPREGVCKVPIGGDIRASEMAGLATMHTLFLREHNRVCELLWELPIKWSKLGDKGCVRDECDELLYQNARRIVNAEWQNIIYSEFLPIVLGPAAMQKHKLDLDPLGGTKFNKSMNPNILASFSTAAYRFGHSLIQGMVIKRNMNGTMNKTYSLSDTFFKTVEFLGDGADQIIAGMVKQPIQSSDRFVSTQVSQLLFKENKRFGKDLIALNIQRGRDHGIPSYSEFYKQMNFTKDDPNREMKDWSKRPLSFSADNWNKFREVYKHPQDIELFPGGLLENKNPEEGLVGTVFREIIARQFSNLMHGDRFFFTNKDTGFGHEFDDVAREHLLTRKLSDIICDNTDIEVVPTHAFRPSQWQKDNPNKMCNSSGVNSLDVNKINILSTFCNGTIPTIDRTGKRRCCTEAKQCKENQGNCDNDDQCMSGLSCGIKNCKDLFPTDSFALGSNAGCCVKNISP